MASSTHKRQRPDSDDDEHEASTIFTSQENFARYLIIESKNKEKPVTSLSLFVIEKQIESMIGTSKSVKKLKNGTLLAETTRKTSVKKLKNGTLLVETTWKTQTENLKKQTSFFGVPVEVTEHKSLNSSKDIIRNPILRSETEENILEYLKPQGVTHVKRFTIRKNHEIVNTNTLLLTFNSVVTPKTLKIFYQIIQVEMYVRNPLRCFNCQKFGHHAINCHADLGSVCGKCGTGNHDHLTSQCKNPAKCVNCGENHMSRSRDCDVWKKEKEIIKIKVTQRLTYPEARKIYDQQRPEVTSSKVVSSMPKKPETETSSTQYNVKDSEITESSKVIISRIHKQNQTNQNSTSKSSSTSAQKQHTNSKQSKQIVISDTIRKGSNDPIQDHNRFGALADDGDMDTDEVTVRPGGRSSRPRHLSSLQSSFQSILL